MFKTARKSFVRVSFQVLLQQYESQKDTGLPMKCCSKVHSRREKIRTRTYFYFQTNPVPLLLPTRILYSKKRFLYNERARWFSYRNGIVSWFTTPPKNIVHLFTTDLLNLKASIEEWTFKKKVVKRPTNWKIDIL